MSEPKFDSFIYDVDYSYHYTKEIENDSIYYSKYEGHMICPECLTARLMRSHSRNGSVYIKTIPNSPHGFISNQKCYHSQDIAPQYIIRNYINNLNQDKRLQPKLESLIRIIKSRDIKSLSNNNSLSFTKELTIKYTPKNSTKEKNDVIPKYSINQWYYIPTNEIVALYGKVKILVKNTPSSKFPDKINTYWHIYNIKSDKKITSMWANTYPLISDGIYYFATFATKEEYKGFYNLVPIFKYNCVLVEKL